jgi:Concanavalin A-like lectin/glucanases superfamily
VGQDRAFQAHVPWGDLTIYFDTGGGCCDGTTQRINATLNDFPPTNADPATYLTNWHHFVFQKSAGQKQVWIDGTLFLEGQSIAPLTTSFDILTIGSDSGGGNNTHGDIDDFAVFASALTPAEVTSLFQGTAPDKLPGRVPVVSAVPRIAIRPPTAGNVTLEWTGTAILQKADTVTGSWSDIAGAASPYPVQLTGSASFFRLKQNP